MLIDSFSQSEIRASWKLLMLIIRAAGRSIYLLQVPQNNVKEEVWNPVPSSIATPLNQCIVGASSYPLTFLMHVCNMLALAGFEGMMTTTCGKAWL